jgi:hypothetical protein
MRIFNKENGTHPIDNVPLKLKKFFDMSKITTFNLVLQRNGEKNCHLITYQRDTKFYLSLG